MLLYFQSYKFNSWHFAIKNPKNGDDKNILQQKIYQIKNYDYAQNGMYFITICTHNREPILSKISKIGNVGAGLVPALDDKNGFYPMMKKIIFIKLN